MCYIIGRSTTTTIGRSGPEEICFWEFLHITKSFHFYYIYTFASYIPRISLTHVVDVLIILFANVNCFHIFNVSDVKTSCAPMSVPVPRTIGEPSVV